MPASSEPKAANAKYAAKTLHRAIAQTASAHRSLDEDSPLSRPVQRIGRIMSMRWSAGCITSMLESEFSVHTVVDTRGS